MMYYNFAHIASDPLRERPRWPLELPIGFGKLPIFSPC